MISALATASRVRILARLREGACSVRELTDAVGMAQPAVSHQLRVLRDLGLVSGTREVRSTVYSLHDPHVAVLLDEVLRHIQHLAAGSPSEADRGEPLREVQTGYDGKVVMTEQHTHNGAHAHEHSHEDVTHNHVHTEHVHSHVEHEHEHLHDGQTHSHSHAHQSDRQEEHEHAHG